jgi:hypothetical protein
LTLDGDDAVLTLPRAAPVGFCGLSKAGGDGAWNTGVLGRPANPSSPNDALMSNISAKEDMSIGGVWSASLLGVWGSIPAKDSVLGCFASM